MRTSFLSALAAAVLCTALCSYARATPTSPEGFVSSNITGNINCDSSGNCGIIYLTPATDGYAYWYQATCLTSASGSTINTSSIYNCNWGAFNPSTDVCDFGNATWGTSCPLTVRESGLSPGAYSTVLYLDYVYCPTSQFNGTTCSAYYQNVQTIGTVQGSVASTSSITPIPEPGIFGLLALSLLGVFGLRRGELMAARETPAPLLA